LTVSQPLDDRSLGGCQMECLFPGGLWAAEQGQEPLELGSALRGQPPSLKLGDQRRQIFFAAVGQELCLQFQVGGGRLRGVAHGHADAVQGQLGYLAVAMMQEARIAGLF